MNIFQAKTNVQCSGSRLAKIQAQLPRLKFWMYTLLVLSLLGWAFELTTGTVVLMAKGLSVFMAIIIATFVAMISVALEHACRVRGLDWLDKTIKWSAVIALVGWGSFMFEGFSTLGLIPGTSSKGVGGSSMTDIQSFISNINILILYAVFPVCYLVIGYLLASAVSAFRKHYQHYNNSRLLVPEWKQDIERLQLKFKELDNCGKALDKTTMSKSSFLAKGLKKQKQALAKIIEVMDEALNKKENWLDHLGIITTADSKMAGMAEYLAQVRTKNQLLDMRQKAAVALATY